ncbi:MAG TPA: hypothetical protein VD908_19335 [Cytophagales bacterium]|nr:hypothetical protein [Cytophagales bacterium]
MTTRTKALALFPIKKLHYFSGITLAVFITFHLINHLASLMGSATHIEWMELFRKVYRHPIIETLLTAAVVFQIATGVKLLSKKKERIKAEKIQIYSGLYLSFFLLAHVSAVFAGRYLEHLDTNFYFAGVGLNYYPSVFFFIPYYFLAVSAIFLHIASLHYLKTKSVWTSYVIATIGIITSVLIIIGFTNEFQWLEVPVEYQHFIEKYFGKGH